MRAFTVERYGDKAGVRAGDVPDPEVGANDVLVAVDGKRERLIPFVLDDYVREVDFDAGLITVDWDPDF